MRKLILTLFFALLLVLPLISAWEPDNIKEYNVTDRSITIKNSFMLIPDVLYFPLGEVAKITPLTPHNQNFLSAGRKIVHKFKVNLTEGYTEGFFDGYEVWNINNGNKTENRNIVYKKQILTPYEATKYIEVCEDSKDINITSGKLDKICRLVEDGTETRYTENWETIDTTKDLGKGEFIFGIEADVKIGDYVEVVPVIANKRLTEYSTWTANFNVGLIAYFDGNSSTNLLDSYPNINLSAFQGTPTFGMTDADSCLIGKCINVTTNANFKITNNTLMNYTGNLTLSFWVRGQQVQANPFAWGYLDDTQSIGWDTPTRVYIGTAITGVANTNAGTVGYNKWFHIVITINSSGNNVTVYLNGSVATSGTTGTMKARNGDLLFGSHSTNYGTDSFKWNGQFDEIAVWDRTLTKAEVVDLFNDGAGLTFAGAEPTPIALDITLVTPDNKTITTKTTNSFTANATATNSNLTNATLYMYNQTALWKINYTDITDDAIFKQINSSFDSMPEGNYSWNYEFCVTNSSSDSFCNFTSANRTFVIDRTAPNFVLTNPTGNYYAPNLIFDINYTKKDIGGGGGSCWYSYNNGANVTLANCANATLNFSRLSNQNITVWVNDSVNNVNSSSKTFIYYPALALCNATVSFPFINISFADEATAGIINGNVTASTWTYYDSFNSSNSRSYSFTNTTGAASYQICASPNWSSLNITPTVSYSGGGYPGRIWSPSVAKYTNTSFYNKTLYLLNTATGIYVTWIISNAALQPIAGALVNATTALGLIASGTTDSAGGTTFWLNPNTLTTIDVLKTGYSLYSTSLYPTQSSYTITLGSSNASAVTDYTQGIIWSIQPTLTSLTNGTTYNFNFTINSTYWSLESYGFNITNGTLIGATVSDTVATGGVVDKNVNTGSNQTIVITAYWVINQTITSVTRTYAVINDADSGFSILQFGSDLKTYLAGGMFGLTIPSFSGNIIIFLVIFLTAGIVSWKFGLTSPAVISTIVFAMVAFFDIGLGLILNPVTAVPSAATVFMFLITVSLAVKEATGY